MSKEVKYIVGLDLSDINKRKLEAIVFATSMTHKDAAKMFGFGDNVVGAGFARLGLSDGKIEVSVYGRSESLGIERHPLDGKYVRRALGLQDADMSNEERIADYQAGVDVVSPRKRAAAQGRTLSGRAG